MLKFLFTHLSKNNLLSTYFCQSDCTKDRKEQNTTPPQGNSQSSGRDLNKTKSVCHFERGYARKTWEMGGMSLTKGTGGKRKEGIKEEGSLSSDRV